MGVFDRSDSAGGGAHEQVVFCQDPASGLKAIIAVFSTALGPALGGTRFHPYPSEWAALADVLRLSRGMAYKSACAGLDLGGGKAVIIGDPATHKSTALLRAYGRCVQSLGGRYYTACDVGTDMFDMDTVAEESRFVVGRSPEGGGSADSGGATALGVFHAMRAAAEFVWDSDDLTGRRVGVEGVGNCGAPLVTLLLAAGAKVTVSDTSPAAIAAITAVHPDVTVVEPASLPSSPLDIYAPCALGGSLSEATVSGLTARVVCGAANNQLAHAGVGTLLNDRGVVYVPDYLANAGGMIQVGAEIDGSFRPDRARAKVVAIHDRVWDVLRAAETEGVPPATAADRLAERRIAGAGRPHGACPPR